MSALFYSLVGYFSGSVLFAKIYGFLLKRKDITENTVDQNPGTANAFKNGGFACGALTLFSDLLKGFLPVWLYLNCGEEISGFGLALVMASPVLGHIFPIFNRFRGGKGIAVSFGCLLGLLPEIRPLLVLAGCFIFFSVVFKVTDHYHRTMLTYIISSVGMLFAVPRSPVCLGFTFISALVITKLLMSGEEKEKFKVEIIWKR